MTAQPSPYKPSKCNAATTDRLSGCLAQCILEDGHDGLHTDGGGMSWEVKPFSAHDLDIDNSGSRISRLLREKSTVPQYIPPRTRCARCGLIEVCGERENEPVCARCVWEMLDEERRERAEVSDALNERVRELEAERDDLRAAGRAVVEAFNAEPNYVERCDSCGQFATRTTALGMPLCDKHWMKTYQLHDLPYAPAWRTLCALVKP